MDYRPFLFKQIHEIVFHGNGGYDWNTVYNMPLWLRRATYNLMKEHYEKEKEREEKQQNMIRNMQNNKKDIPNGPNINPNYTTQKAPKK